MKNFAEIISPFTDLLKGDRPQKGCRRRRSPPVVWSEILQTAFDTIIEKLTTAPVLAFADFKLPFVLHTDASLQGLGAVLYQKQEGKLRVIAYASRKLKPSETKYPAHKLEFLALKWAVVDKFYDYLYGHKFEVHTDNNPLTYILSSAKLDAMGHRWLASLSSFDFKIFYRPGKTNIDADSLSRMYTDTEDSIKELSTEAIEAICQQWLDEDTQRPEPLVVSMAVSAETVPVDGVSKCSTMNESPDWASLQQDDPVISRVLDYLKGGKPSKALIRKEPLPVRKLLYQWEKLQLKDGVLVRRRQIDHNIVLQLVLPRSHQEEALKGIHDDLGHLGYRRTMELAQERFFWPFMSRDIERHVKYCERCIRRKANPPKAAPLVNITSNYPMELVCIDYLSLEPSKGGFEHILVITDHFSHYAQAIPTRNQTAQTTARVLWENFFVHYGFPAKLHSDQGRNFESKVIADLCKVAGVKKTRTTPAHPQCNGVTERFNRTLLNMLGTLTEEKKLEWRKYVPQLVHAYNATRHETSGVSPYFLMFSRHPRLPIDVAFGLDPNARLGSEYGRNLMDRMKYVYDVVRAETEKQCHRRKKNYDKKVREAMLQVGDRVLVKRYSFIGKHKIADRWEKGVYIVSKQPDDQIPVYMVESEVDGKSRTLHRNMLLPISFLPGHTEDITLKERKQRKQVREIPLEGNSSSSSDEEEIVPVGHEDSNDALNNSGPDVIDGDSDAQNSESDHDCVPEEPDAQNSESDQDSVPEEPSLRRSTRERRPPTWYTSGDFVVNSCSAVQSIEEVFV